MEANTFLRNAKTLDVDENSPGLMDHVAFYQLLLGFSSYASMLVFLRAEKV